MKVLLILTVVLIIINVINAKESFNSGKHIKSAKFGHNKQKTNFKRSNLHFYENQLYPDAFSSSYGYQNPGFYPEAKFHRPTIVSNNQLHYGFPHHLHIEPTASGLIQPAGVQFALPGTAPEVAYPAATQYILGPGSATVSSYSATYPQYYYHQKQYPHYKIPIAHAPVPAAAPVPVHVPAQIPVHVPAQVPVHVPAQVPVHLPAPVPVHLPAPVPTPPQPVFPVVTTDNRPILQHPFATGFQYHIQQQNYPISPIIPAPVPATAVAPIAPVVPITPVTPVAPQPSAPPQHPIFQHHPIVPNTFFVPRPFVPVQRPIIIIGSQPRPTDSSPSQPPAQGPEITPVGSGSAILPGQIPPQTTVNPPTTEQSPNIPWRPIITNNNPTNIPSPSSNRPSVTLVPPYGRQPSTLEEFEVAYYNEGKPSGTLSHQGYHYK